MPSLEPALSSRRDLTPIRECRRPLWVDGSVGREIHCEKPGREMEYDLMTLELLLACCRGAR